MQLVTGKKGTDVGKIELVGTYVSQLRFDDSHNTGIFPWQTLRELGSKHEANWEDYLKRLEDAGASRDKLRH